MLVATATQAKTQFGKILEEAGREPVTIKKSGRDVAVILSFNEYKRVTEIEDKYWLKKAQQAHKEGFIGIKASKKLLDDLLNAED